MRAGGTQTKRSAAVRMRRRLGLAPRAYVLLSCSLVLVVAGVSAYGMTVPSMVQAHAARELHIGRKAKSDLGTTTGYAWASVVGRTVFGVDPADEGEQASNEITLANGKTIVLTNTKVITKLSNNSVASVVNKAEQQKGQDTQQAGKPGGSDGGSGCGSGCGVALTSGTDTADAGTGSAGTEATGAHDAGSAGSSASTGAAEASAMTLSTSSPRMLISWRNRSSIRPKSISLLRAWSTSPAKRSASTLVNSKFMNDDAF